MTAGDEDKAQVLQAYRDMYRAMLAGRTDELGALLDDQYSLTHVTGLRRPPAPGYKRRAGASVTARRQPLPAGVNAPTA